jgi:hypothetical protein
LGWIAAVMFGLIVASLILEKILPMSVKERAGEAICWGMMAVTMAFLGLSTISLAYILGRQVWAAFT